MRHDQLRSIAHNIADSLASGNGLLIGVYDIENVFHVASRCAKAQLVVDFLAGTACGTDLSPSMAKALALYRDVLPRLCESHGGTRSMFRVLLATYWAGSARRVTVVIEDAKGRRSADEYVGLPLQRVRILDAAGRIRRKKGAFT